MPQSASPKRWDCLRCGACSYRIRSDSGRNDDEMRAKADAIVNYVSAALKN
jgi:hypothetical protein